MELTNFSFFSCLHVDTANPKINIVDFEALLRIFEYFFGITEDIFSLQEICSCDAATFHQGANHINQPYL